MILAKDIMSEEVVVIYEDMLVRQVAHLLLRNRVSAYPIINKKIGVVGIITMTDLFQIINKSSDNNSDKEFHERIDQFKDMEVREVMSSNVFTIAPDTSLDEIVRILVEKEIHTFPVMENEELVGIVSRHDILNAIFSYD